MEPHLAAATHPIEPAEAGDERTLALALAHYRAGRLEAAANLCRDMLFARPENHEAINLLGVVRCRSEQFEEGADCFRSALALSPTFAQAHLNLGNALRKLDLHEQAAASYRRAIEIEPHYARAHCELGAILADQGDLAAATDSYRRASSEFREQGRLDEALAAARQVLTLRPEDPAAHNESAMYWHTRASSKPRWLASSELSA